MKLLFKPGDVRTFEHVVTSADTAAFHEQIVHEVYATFSLARDAEWTSRQFVIDGRESDEEGIGTFITLEHKAPAFPGDTVLFKATVDSFDNNELVCSFEARVGEKLIAIGKTGQKVLKREKLNRILRRVDV